MEPKDLDKQISSGKIGSLYFFYGEEQFLLENKVKAIKLRIIESDFEEFNFIKLDGKKVTADDIESALLSVPVMSDKKMVVVSNCGIFGNAKLKEFSKVCDSLGDIPEYLTVIFTEKEFDKKKEKNLEVFKKHGEIVKFDPLSPKQLELWLEKMFEEKGKSVLASDLSRMVVLCGQSMASIYNEYQKLLNFVGERERISASDIEAVVSKSTDARIFDIVDNIAEGRTKKVFEEINVLHEAGEKVAGVSASTVMSLLVTRIGELLMIRQLSGDKVSPDKIAEYFEPRKHPYVLKKLTEQSRHFSVTYLREMTQKGLEYIAMVRAGLMDEWIAVEMYVAELVKK